MSLLKTQKNDIFKVIAESELPPSAFKWEMRDTDSLGWLGDEADTLVHVATGFYCLIYNMPSGARVSRGVSAYDSEGDYAIEFEPGDQSREQSVLGVALISVARYIRQWLQSVVREATEPDMWAEIAAAPAGVTEVMVAESDEENTPFSSDEKRRLFDGLEEIKDTLRANYDLTADQSALMEAKFALLNNSAERLGRKDWKVIFIGTIVQIAAQAALSTQAAHGLLQIAGEVLRWLFHPPGLILP